MLFDDNLIYGREEEFPLLAHLANERVFGFVKNDRSRTFIIEMCDEYYGVPVDRAFLESLAIELSRLAAELAPAPHPDEGV